MAPVVQTVQIPLPDGTGATVTIAQLRALHQLADGPGRINHKTAAALEQAGLVHDLEGVTCVLTDLGHTIADRLPDIPEATRPHGTNACYVIDQCRCDRCRTAATEYRRRWDRDRAYGRHRTVDAQPVRDHVEYLRTNGVGLKRIARLSGVANGALTKLVYGGEGRPPSRRVRTATAQALLNVDLTSLADGATVPAAPTWTRLDQMLAAGFAKAELGRLIVGPTAKSLQLSRRRITAGNARRVAELHRAWTDGNLEPHGKCHRGCTHD